MRSFTAKERVRSVLSSRASSTAVSPLLLTNYTFFTAELFHELKKFRIQDYNSFGQGTVAKMKLMEEVIVALSRAGSQMNLRTS